MKNKSLIISIICLSIICSLGYSAQRVWEYFIAPDIAPLIERANQDDVPALRTLSLCYRFGIGTKESPQDMQKCQILLAGIYKHRAQEGNVEALFLYASTAYSAALIDREEFNRCCERAAEQGCAEAIHNVAERCRLGIGREESREKQMEWLYRLLSLAQNGDAKAQYYLGLRGSNYLGQDGDAWMLSAAEQGYLPAIAAMRDISGSGKLPSAQDTWGLRYKARCEALIRQGDEAVFGDLCAYQIRVNRKELNSFVSYIRNVSLLRKGIEAGAERCACDWALFGY